MDKVFFMSNQTLLFIPIEQMLFIHWKNRKLYVHTKDEVYSVSGHLKDYSYLTKHHFRKMGRNILVNYNVIHYVEEYPFK